MIAAVVLALAAYIAYEAWWPEGEGRLVVVSEPSGAQIWLDLEATDYVTGGPPIPLAPGRHSVKVKLDTLESIPIAHVVDIRADATDTVRFVLHAVEIKRPPKRVVPPPEPAAEQLAEAAPEKPKREIPEIPTADELRRRAQQKDTVAAVPRKIVEATPRTDTLPPSPVERKPTSGLVEVSSSLLEARIIVDDKLRREVTPAELELPHGIHTIRVEMPGYEPRPTQADVKITADATKQFVFFDLVEKDTVKKEIRIKTTPVAGIILVDSVRVGTGEAVVPHNFGMVVVSFGPVEGYVTPEPVRLALTPTNPTPEVNAIYIREFRAMVQVNGPNVVATDGDISWTTGVYFEKDGAQPTSALGAKIREIPGSQKFGWELAMGDPNRNPTGGDYIEFQFTLPPDVPPDSPLKLRLCIYRSPRRYPFALSSQSEIVVSVNDRLFLNGFRPTHATEVADIERFEEWSLKGMLVEGKNRVRIHAGEGNTVYSYLWKLEVR
ncbi:PEGA domain-containing protein [bacterium]|nr:PEGA domain-containing protein [bacterium]